MLAYIQIDVWQTTLQSQITHAQGVHPVARLKTKVLRDFFVISTTHARNVLTLLVEQLNEVVFRLYIFTVLIRLTM